MSHFAIQKSNRGPKPKRIIDETWSPNLAYAVGLLASDGCLTRAQHLIDLTSIDIEQLNNYKKCLGISTKITSKFSGIKNPAYRVQFKNVIFYHFLESVGLTPAKSRTINEVKLPNQYFFDFLRGLFDGDGCSYSYWDPRWRSSFMFYLSFTSASSLFVKWLKKKIEELSNCDGKISVNKKKDGRNPYYQLRFAKNNAKILVQKMYYSDSSIYLSRKKLKIDRSLAIIAKQEAMYALDKVAQVM